MLPDRPDPKETGRIFALGQVGLEMVVPIGIGIWIDTRFETPPWGIILGAFFGFFGGMAHLLLILRHQEEESRRRKGQGPR